jgi:hypothetical protein
MEDSTQVDGDTGSHEPRIAEVVRLATAAPTPKLWTLRPSRQKAAARLLPELIDDQLVDQVLALPDGTTGGWLDEDEQFRDKVVSMRLALESSADPDIDYTRALTPKQARAAILLVEQEMTPTKVAESVGVDPRTIRNWRRQPVFRRSLEQLTGQRSRQLQLEAEAENSAARRRERELRQKAERVLSDLLDADDAKTAGMVYKLLIDR